MHLTKETDLDLVILLQTFYNKDLLGINGVLSLKVLFDQIH